MTALKTLLDEISGSLRGTSAEAAPSTVAVVSASSGPTQVRLSFTSAEVGNGSDNDSIVDFLSGTDSIDLSAFGIDAGDTSEAIIGANTVITVDADSNGSGDFTITLLNTTTFADSDYIFN